MAPQEIVIGINAFSVPIFQSDGDCIAAITLVGSMQYLGEKPTAEQLATLRAAGHAVSNKLGFHGEYPYEQSK
ncbi:IclR family transcriptional regulator domain-containing protein [Bradyrhizobium macuxiense]|uniref:IclR family transcriptional regulator domain-containing protein n=1 Tax=Bradyrhizobium macuxiense TaxID=1755647 RepID=UPI0011BEAB37|nr:IclR family transcriptional regulator C-terminal domain-containing protein [Bradyrhizobium macuxiense]